MKKGQKQKKYLIGGERLTVRQIAKQPWCQVCENTLYTRLRNGMNLVEAITTKPHQTRKKYLYKGKMRSAAYLAELPECKVSRGTLWQRLETYGIPVELAVTLPVIDRHHRNSKEWKKDKRWGMSVGELIEMLDAKSQGA